MLPEAKNNEARPDPHAQMLKLVAKGFYRELINYGVKEAEVLTVAGHLLDNVVLKSSPANTPEHSYSSLFKLNDVQDDWAADRRLSLQEITLSPLRMDSLPRIAAWLDVPKVRNSFFPRFPTTVDALERYFLAPDCEYLGITYQDECVGIIGGEHADESSSKVEMKKLVGESEMRGKGIGKQATFLFLYFQFIVRARYKVYLHTMDINIRNLNLNGNFGFWLEGVFFEDVVIDDQRRDIIRMALTAPAWRKLFA